MPVEDVFSITGRGTVATGRVERGTLHVSDEVEIVGIKEESRKLLSQVSRCSVNFLTKLKLVITLVHYFVAVSYTHLQSVHTIQNVV